MENGGMSVADVAALNGNSGFGHGFEGLIYLAVIASMFGNGNWFGNNRGNDTSDALLAATIASNNANNGFANAIGYENLATSSEVQRGFDNQNSVANQREILSAVNAASMAGVNATNQSYHDIISALGDKYSELQRDVAANAVSIQQGIASGRECCCDIKQLIQATSANTDAQIASAKYDNALGIAGINSNIAQNKYEAALNTANINSGIAQNRYEAAMNTASINETITAQTQKVLDTLAQNKIEDLQSQVNDLRLQNQLASVVRYPNNTFYAVPSPCFNPCGCGCAA